MKKFKRITGFLLGIILLLGFTTPAAFAVHADDVLVSVTEQPQDAFVNYPEGASFHVGVDHPEQVESYQWYASDGYTVFMLDGTSARSDTLVVPSTQEMDPDMFYECEITDKNGNKVYSDSCALSLLNHEEEKKVLYILDYALEPGDSIDLAEIGGGSGKVTFESNGTVVTFDNAKINNSTITYDTLLAPSNGIFLNARDTQDMTMTFHINGGLTVTNTYYDEKYNSGGVAVNMFFAGGNYEDERPKVIFEGDGLLTVEGGSNEIYTDGDLEFRMDVETHTLGNVFCDGIRGNNVTFGENLIINIDARGTAIHSEKDIKIEKGTIVTIRSDAPHVSVGPTVKNIIFCVGSTYVNNAEIWMDGIATPGFFVPYGSVLATFNGVSLLGDNGDLVLNNSRVTINLHADHSDQLYAMNFNGITSEAMNNSVKLNNGSELIINVEAEEVINGSGMYLSGSLFSDKGSKISVDIKTSGETSGIEADGQIYIVDSNVDVKAESGDGSITLGMVSSGTSIDLNDSNFNVHSIAVNGIAMACDTGDHEESEVSYQEGYKAEKLILKGKSAIIEPAKNEISLCGVAGYGGIIKAETIYDSTDTSAPASEVRVSSVAELSPIYWMVGAAVIAVAAAFYFAGRKKKA